jgi:precorrin-2 dehydrogenase/sirohydrochlorin ferrochelatase
MKSKRLSNYYPVFLNVNGRSCVVVGGGQVARRKVEGLLECGASVTVVSPDLCPTLDELARQSKIEAVREPYRPGALRGAFIAIAAAGDNRINRAVAVEAKQAGIPVNVVDGVKGSDFIAPSCLRRGDITIAVSTAGASPALARKIRTRLEKDFGEEYASLAAVVEEVRAGLKRRGIKVDGEDWQKALDVDLMVALIKKGEKEKARSLLLNKLKAMKK